MPALRPIAPHQAPIVFAWAAQNNSDRAVTEVEAPSNRFRFKRSHSIPQCIAVSSRHAPNRGLPRKGLTADRNLCLHRIRISVETPDTWTGPERGSGD